MRECLADYPPMLNTTDIATFFGVTPRTVRKFLAKEAIPSIRIGRKMLVSKPDLINYLETHKTKE